MLENIQINKTMQQRTLTEVSKESINIQIGYITATRIIAADYLQVSSSKLMELFGIRANTGATAMHTAELMQIRKDVSEMNL